MVGAALRKKAVEDDGQGVDYSKRPSEDFASTTIEFDTSDGYHRAREASTSCELRGCGTATVRELLGPEYSMAWNSRIRV